MAPTFQGIVESQNSPFSLLFCRLAISSCLSHPPHQTCCEYRRKIIALALLATLFLIPGVSQWHACLGAERTTELFSLCASSVGNWNHVWKGQTPLNLQAEETSTQDLFRKLAEVFPVQLMNLCCREAGNTGPAWETDGAGGHSLRTAWC